MGRTHFTHQEIIAMNRAVQQWASHTGSQMKGNLPPGDLKSGFKGSNRYNFGLISSVGYQFPRHGVFLEMGVFGGKNRKESQARGYQPRPWFNPVVDRRLDALNEAIGQVTDKMVINATRIKIKNT